ncbi:putative RNA helicase SDE3 [Citrus sinensis]|uniref:RNA helicase SDE3 n=1 Tax=Citrus sinensis TaxID=2711 RepID=A0ACB8LEE4_CITSI|nr:putative RNA helicase SDE3 [Citrus sinensis]
MSVLVKILRCIFCCYDEDYHDTERDYQARLLGTYNHNSSVRNSSYHNSSVRNSSYHNSSVRNSSFTNHDLLRQHDSNKIYYYEYYPNVSISEPTTKQPNAMSQQTEYGDKSSLKGNNEVSQSLKSSRPSPPSSSCYTCSSSPNKSQSLTQLSSFPNPASASSKPFLSPKGPAPSSSSNSSSSFPKPAIPSSKASSSLSSPASSALSQSLSSLKPHSFNSDQHQLTAKPPESLSPFKSSQSSSGSTSTKNDTAPKVLNKPLLQKAPPSSQPTLAPLPPDSTNQQEKDSCLLVEKGSSNYKIPKDIEDLSKKDVVPNVLKKPLSPSTYKDYFAALPYAEDFYHVEGSSSVYMPPKNNENLMKKEAAPEVLKKPSSPLSQKTPSSLKPALSPLPNDCTNQQTKGNRVWVQKGTSPVYFTHKNNENLMKKEAMPEVLTKPSYPSSHKSPSSSNPTPSPLPSDSTNQQTKGNDTWVQKGTLPVYMTPKNNENFMKKEVVHEVLKKPSSPLFHKASSSSKPMLSPLPTDSTNQQKKASFIWVQKGATNYKIPKDIEDLIKKDIVPEVLKKPLLPSTYKDYFAALLYAEDFYDEKWSGFQLFNVTLELHKAAIYDKSLKNKNLEESDETDDKLFVAFEIDSVPERRPFLLSRDFVYVQRSGGKSKKFQGFLYRVVKWTIVLVEFEEDFHSQHQPNHKYDVSFSFNRVCLKRAHEAIADASDSLFRNYVFPDCASRKSIPYPSLCPYSNYKLDSDSNSAVHQILSFEGQSPYLLEGPLCNNFVLSKTGNVVREAVLQIRQRSPKSRILICAPWNRTCDKLMECLMKDIPASEMFRANAAFREADGVSDEIFQVSLVERECFSCPPLEELRQYKVISSTFVSSFRLHNQGITAGHFSHIFLIDASSATEPETMIVLGNLANENTRVIVTGAPHNSKILLYIFKDQDHGTSNETSEIDPSLGSPSYNTSVRNSSLENNEASSSFSRPAESSSFSRPAESSSFSRPVASPLSSDQPRSSASSPFSRPAASPLTSDRPRTSASSSFCRPAASPLSSD